ncbi:type VI secretion system-associated protein TagF [Limnobacter humi]|uniref:Type VI secretion system-associated protein TagF n=1 Tax=Limnobacter humi TaxID=1778671 RepID=A0ABT1WD70_9BURK|nr:type VI secretion system-associated protein TagF [Limnobacter humi]MCQ8895467.1 type VI secretion system-associated protein TagF [Limnobacter humi]
MCLGKIPGVGDFVSRGITPTMARDWYDCLSHWMQSGQVRRGADWPTAFLGAAALGFHGPDSLAQDRLPLGHWLGVVLPSVDRVGRLFPWLVMEYHTGPLSAHHLSLHLQQCFDMGIAAIRDNWNTRQLDALFSQPWHGDTNLPITTGPWYLWSLDHGQPPSRQGAVARLLDVSWP